MTRPAPASARTDIAVSLARLGEIPEDQRVIGDPTYNRLLIYDNTGFVVSDGAVVAPADGDLRIRKSLQGTFPNVDAGVVNGTAVGGVVLEGNADLDTQTAATKQVIEVLKDASFEGFDLTVTGSPVYLADINDYLKGGMLTLGAAALALMAIVLAVLFRVRWRLLPLLAVVVGVLWAFSMLGLIGISLSLVTISGLPILIGVGIDFAIQVHNRVEEEVVLDKEAHPIAETLSNLAPPLIAATLTGVFAFLALRISKVPMIRDFGVLLAIGIVMLVIVGIVIPASALGIREYKKRTEVRPPSFAERACVDARRVADQVRAPPGDPLGAAVPRRRARGRTRQDRVRSDQVGRPGQPGREGHRDARGRNGLLVDARHSRRREQRLRPGRHRPDLGVHAGCRAASRGRLDVEHGQHDGQDRRHRRRDSDLADVRDVDVVQHRSTEMPGAIQRRRCLRAPDDPTATQLNLRLAPASLDERAALVAELEADLQSRIDALDLPADSILLTDLPDGQDPVRATPAGLATVGIGLLENLSANRANLTYLALSLAGLFLVLRFRSLSRALLALGAGAARRRGLLARGRVCSGSP